MSNPIRILHVTAGMNRGGSETLMMNLYRNIDKTKVQFDFILHTQGECIFNEEIRKLGGRIYSVPRYKGFNHFKYKKAWNIIFKLHPEYKIIHAHVRSTASIFLRIAKRFGLKTISHSHSTSSRGNRLERIVKKIIQFPIKHIAEYFFACSESAGKWLFGNKILKQSNFKIINNAIDVEKYVYDEIKRKEVREFLGIQDKFVVGHIGYFTKPKNHIFILEVFKEIYNKNNKAVLLLIGDGELRSVIESKISKLQLENNVILVGIRSDIPELLQAMDVFVFPSLFEGLGIVAIEAQAAGLPCIVADTIPQEAFVTDIIESLSLKVSPEIWANKILDYKNHKRRNTYHEIVNKGYDIKETVKWLEKFYLTC